MKLKFTKMQSLGNDFVILNGIEQQIQVTDKIARHIADRHFGVGCDQILVVELQDNRVGGNNGYLFRIFNSDGSEVGQCGNGARCFARFLYDQGLTDEPNIQVQTRTTTLQLSMNQDDTVTVGMGVPEFMPENIPLAIPQQSLTYHIETRSGKVAFSALSIGNPHCVLFVEDIQNADVRGLGPDLENDPLFPERVNVGFCQVISRQKIRLRVHERGVGETLGCGSGACAAVISGICNDLLDSRVEVVLPGGSAWVEWNGQGSQVYLTGPTHKVFDGTMEI